jgi:DNA polymerase-3 subunit epsilon
MNWLQRLWRKPARLSPEQAAKLAAYHGLFPCKGDTPITEQCLVVVDVESTGLDIFRDKLISIGAISVEAQTIQLNQSFETVLQQNSPSSVDNILVHGIGGTEQVTGKNPADALLDFLSYAGNAPLVAYHAGFDRAMIDRATRSFLGMTLKNTWIDLALIAPALFPQKAAGRRALDDWTALFSIENSNRHNAVSDACATAQLLLVLLAQAERQGIRRLQDWTQLEKAQHWLARS